MNNMIRGKQGYYQDDNPRLSSSSSSSPGAAAYSLDHHHHHKGGVPVSCYSYHRRPPSWDIETTGGCGGVGGLMRWNYGSGGGGRERGANTSQLHDHLMMISMDSSSSPTTATTTTINTTIFNLPIDDGRGGGGGEFSEGPTSSATAGIIEREHMFDKVVTPSDVGKLNRLVIPKQHAEKYFPLDSSTNEKGLLLNFEDRNGKPWRFRYSYWNSSQSYVMTKGWSRFVKEKKLDAGDIVSFHRGLGEVGKDRLFIDRWRRPDAPPPPSVHPPHHLHHHFSFHHPWTQYPPYYLQQPNGQQRPAACNLLQINNSTSRQHQYRNHHHHHHPNSRGVGMRTVGNPCSGSLIYFNRSPKAKEGGGVLREIIQDEEEDDESSSRVFESVPVVQGKDTAKRLRLFGVNMDCPIDDGSDPHHRHDHHDQLMAEDQCGGILSSTAVPLSTTLMPAAAASQSHHHSSTSFSSSISVSPMSLNSGPYNINNVGNAESIHGTGTPAGVLNKGKASVSFDLDI